MSNPSKKERSVSLILPEAPPGMYVRWVERRRRLEHAILKARGAGLDDETVQDGWATLFVTDFLAEQILEQAEAARSERRAVVIPKVQADRRILTRALEHMEQADRWAEDTAGNRPENPGEAEIPPLEWDLLVLERSVESYLRAQRAAELSAAEGGTKGPQPTCPACGWSNLLTVEVTIEKSVRSFSTCETCGWESWQSEGKDVPLPSLLPVLNRP
jgi:hypothetical protein